MNSLKAIVLCLLLVIFNSCERDSLSLKNEGPILSQEMVTSSLSGRIVDMDNRPVEGAKVTLLSGAIVESKMTDEQGGFLFDNTKNVGTTAFISVNAPSKFEAFRRFGLFENQINHTEIKLQSKTIIGSFSARTGGTLENDEGVVLEFPPNGIINSQGEVFEGKINVALAWIDPLANDLSSQMIGDLTGLDLDGTRKVLSTYGMIQVEIFDDSGEELLLATNTIARVQFPVPLELRDSAPSTIPVWSFDEEEGYWVEESIATYKLGSYHTSVTHFSGWNVDIKMDPIEITGTVKFEIWDELVPVGYLAVYLENENVGRHGGWLSNDGAFRFHNIAKGQKFNLSVYSDCSLVYMEEFGPFEEDTDLGEIVESNKDGLTRVKGIVIDCDNEIMQDAKIYLDDSITTFQYQINDDGTFEFGVDLCEVGEAKIIIEGDNGLRKELQLWAGINVGDFRRVYLCDSEQSYVSLMDTMGLNRQLDVGVRAYLYWDTIKNCNIINVGYENPAPVFPTSTIDLEFKESLNTLPFTTDALYFRSFFDPRIGQLNEIGDLQVTITSYKTGTLSFIEGSYKGKIHYNNEPNEVYIEGEFRSDIY